MIHLYGFGSNNNNGTKVVVEKDVKAEKYAKNIKANDLKHHLEILASDEYEGRETGEKGQKMAAEYLKEQFVALGIPPIDGLKDGYFQEFPIDIRTHNLSKLTIDSEEYDYMKDFYYYGRRVKDTTLNLNEIIFLGYGISEDNYDDYKGIDVKGKTILIIEGQPKVLNDKYGDDSEWLYNRSKLILAKEKGAAKVLIVDFNIDKNIKENEHSIMQPQMNLANASQSKSMYASSMYVSPRVGAKFLGLNGKKFRKNIKKYYQGKYEVKAIPCKAEIMISRKKEIVNSENVLGFIEGSDKKDEIVVLTAHYDHIGIHGDIVYNGADDDGSGTVALLEIAESFKKAKDAGHGPRRSVLIMPVSGEEKGLLGSQHYSTNPVFPIENTVVDLNIDMIGRIDKKHEGNEDYVYLIGSDKLSSELHSISEQTNKIYSNLELDYTFNDPNDPNKYYYRSDHYNFAKHDIPVIFYFNGTHEDYHKPTDTVDKINFDKIEKITKLVFYTAWNLANGENRPPVDVKNDFENTY
jgi:hypothetical protein